MDSQAYHSLPGDKENKMSMSNRRELINDHIEMIKQCVIMKHHFELSRFPGHEKPKWTKEVRSKLVEQLEKCLTNEECLRIYNDAHDDICPFGSIDERYLSKSVQAKILKSGLGGLSDEELMQIGLNSTLMGNLYQKINNPGLPDWVNANKKV